MNRRNLRRALPVALFALTAVRVSAQLVGTDNEKIAALQISCGAPLRIISDSIIANVKLKLGSAGITYGPKSLAAAASLELVDAFFQDYLCRAAPLNADMQQALSQFGIELDKVRDNLSLALADASPRLKLNQLRTAHTSALTGMRTTAYPRAASDRVLAASFPAPPQLMVGSISLSLQAFSADLGVALSSTLLQGTSGLALLQMRTVAQQMTSMAAGFLSPDFVCKQLLRAYYIAATGSL